ncbi:MAG: serine hydrolase domain-containing protein [Acidobacteriaceae bacterium]
MRRVLAGLIVLACCVGVGFGQNAPGASGSLAVNSLAPDMQAKIDAAAEAVLKKTGVPSASVAVVEHGAIVYTHAYGQARLQPPEQAEPSMRYSIGSISKQFTAASMLLLEQEGKLSINDPVSKYLPGLTRANEVTIRMLLSHTSGYQDYYPQDYMPPLMSKPTTTQFILDRWGKKPLDFDPGTRWQYSNTNFVIAGQIVEKVSGEPLMKFLQEHIFGPLDMRQVLNTDINSLGDTDAQGYVRNALGPLRPAHREGKGWMFAAGELAMPAYDLAQWDISLMDRSVLSAKSYDEMFAPVMLKNGESSHYGLGLFIRDVDGHAELEHSGEVSGFVSENVVFPNDKAAIAVLTNQDASPAASGIAGALTPLVLGLNQTGAEANPEEKQGREILVGLQQGKIDRSLFTSNCNFYFDKTAMGDYESSLAPLGPPTSFRQTMQELRGGMTFRAFSVTFANSPQKVRVTTYTMPDGKLEQYLVLPVE